MPRHSARAPRNIRWSCGKQAASTTLMTAPTTGTDHAVPAVKQRRAEMRLDRRRVAGPGRIVELEPECDVERKTPKPTDAARTAEKNLRLSGHQSATERE